MDGGFRGHAAGDADGRLKGHVQQRPGGLALGGRLVGLLHLGQDLRFAQHHAVQAGGHAEQVPHGRFIGVDEQVRHDLAGIELMKAGQKVADFLHAGDRRRLAGGVDLHAIAGGKQHAFHVAERKPPLLQGLFRLLPAEGQAFADDDRSAMMAAADDLDVHESPPGRGEGSEQGAGSREQWAGRRDIQESPLPGPGGGENLKSEICKSEICNPAFPAFPAAPPPCFVVTNIPTRAIPERRN